MSKTTENYGLTKPEVRESFSLETWNGNMDKIDKELKKREDAQKESDNSLMNPEFTEAKERKNLTSGEKIHLMLGKIAKFFTDLKTVAFTGSYKDLSNKPTSLPASDVSAWAKANTKPTYTKTEVGLGNVGNFKAVSTVASQGLTDTEKSNARANIGAQAAGSYASSNHNHDSTYRRQSFGIMNGDGKTNYCQLCTLKISQNYVNTPIEITVQERCRPRLDRLSVLFESVNNTDPGLNRFTVIGECRDWYISKTSASTWVIYGLKGESWAGIRVVDYTGSSGINITWNLTGVSSLPSSKTQASWGGNVSHANSADNASTVNGHTVNSNVPANAKFTDTVYDDTKLNGDVAKLKAQSVKKDDVVNNQTTTEEGFALDARQANPNIDGTLAKQLSDLNGSLKIKDVPWTPYCPRTDFADKVKFQEENAMQYGSLMICSIRIELLENTPGGYVQIVNLPKKMFRGINQTNMNGKTGQWYLYIGDNTNSSSMVLRDLFEAGIYYFSFTYLTTE